MNLTDSESLHGSTSAGSDPVTPSDPTGLCRPQSCGAGVAIGGTGIGKTYAKTVTAEIKGQGAKKRGSADYG